MKERTSGPKGQMIAGFMYGLKARTLQKREEGSVEKTYLRG
jgi:hypothetical protein